jgi:hypothetical protein
MRNREALARTRMAPVDSDLKPVAEETRTFNLAGDIDRRTKY